MAEGGAGLSPQEVMQAVGLILDTSPGEVEGYALVGVRPDGSYKIVSNMASIEGSAYVLASAAARTIYDIAVAIPHECSS